ncbi:hypothetical protein GGS21DRAFT_518409, partial [Xylaria nigripes]
MGIFLVELDSPLRETEANSLLSVKNSYATTTTYDIQYVMCPYRYNYLASYIFGLYFGRKMNKSIRIRLKVYLISAPAMLTNRSSLWIGSLLILRAYRGKRKGGN